MKKKTYLITGGSGFLGINLIRFLLKKGVKVKSLDLQKFDYPEKSRVKTVVGDVRDKGAVDKLMKGSDVVVHCAAALPLYPPEEIMSTGVDGTRVVLQSALDHKVERFIFISSTAVYGVPDHHPLVEEDRLVGVGPYGEAKIKAEKLCCRFRKKGLTSTIIRPKTFVGPERLGVFALLYDWARSGCSFPMIGKGNNRYQLLDVRDLARFIYICGSESKTKVNDVFNIGANSFGTMKQDFSVVLQAAGFGKRIVSFPAQPVIFALKILEALKLSPLYPWVYETAGKDSYVSTDKIEQVFNFKCQYSNQQALVENYNWYLANLDTFSNKSGVSHRVPWKQGALGLTKLIFKFL